MRPHCGIARRALLVCAWIAVAWSRSIAPAAAADPTAAPTGGASVLGTSVGAPQEVIGELSSRLFAALGRTPAADRHNTDKLLPLIDRLLLPHFDTEYTARLALGQHWPAATSDQRQHFATAFYQRLLRTYVGAVSDWTPERFKLLPQRSDAAALQVIVHTQVTNPAGVIVPVDYRLRQTTDGWKIFDVIVEGVSYVRSYHDDIDADVSRNGLNATIARLERHDTASSAHERSTN
ncbi:MAG TPA: ABC transporter substrate-binding protein [Steroidobacteraceae bacterium]|nr:ABC transporter substrate-binding protein [Steroidobacteraceae bacterium]